MGVAVTSFAKYQDVINPALGEFDPGTSARGTSTDHEHRHVDSVVRGSVRTVRLGWI
jgi:hypothetical protein